MSRLAETCEGDFSSVDHDSDMADAAKIMVELAIQPKENDEKNAEDGIDDVVDAEDINEEEFQAINAQLDQLNSALDSLEQKNDNIHAELVELLNSSKEVRKQFQEAIGNEQPKDEHITS